MTYEEMRALFVGVARYDGRLSVLVAHSLKPGTPWVVVLRDHARQTWMDVGCVEQLAAAEQGSGPLAPGEHPLTELEALPEPEGAAMTWLQVLWALHALGVIKHDGRGWRLAAIEATRPAYAEPRYRLVLRRTSAAGQCQVDSYDAFERLVTAE